jgi:phosphoribosylaminoimidazolecarboxamide formyltransferase / IMP cyclohydrolase
MKKIALFSLYDTAGAVEFAKKLINAGWEIIASNETVELLQKANLPVINVADFVGIRDEYKFPPTLHPKIEYFLTGKDRKKRIDLVYVINYPTSIGNDVGGRTLLGLAAKGRRIPVNSIVDMDLVVKEIVANKKISEDLRSKLIDKVNFYISKHYFNLLKKRNIFDAVFSEHAGILLNGENPYQKNANIFSFKDQDKLSLVNFRQVSGELPCFVNMADLDCILHTMCICSEAFYKIYNKLPYICIAAKHGNPCGMAIDWVDPVRAVNKALFADPLAIWGGEVITNFTINKGIARQLFRNNKRTALLGSPWWMLDLIAAPGFSREAVKIIGKRKHRKLFENKALSNPGLGLDRYSYRFVRGGALRQSPLNFILNLKEEKTVKNKKIDTGILDSLIIAWAVSYSSNHGGNEVALAKNSSLLACAGGPSTVEAVRTAIFRSEYLRHDLNGSVFSANAFFPHKDAPGLLLKAKVSAGIVPRGGEAFKEIRNLFEQNHISVLYLSEEHRGFSRH